MADGRGGPRSGQVGGRYPNRSDMRAPGQRITPSNLPASPGYGQGVQQASALSVTPTAGSPSAPTSTGASPRQVVLQPGDVPGLSDPSARTHEPVTAGLPVGAGVGPEAMNIAPQDSPEIAIARALFLQYPNPDIRRFIAYLEDTLQF